MSGINYSYITEYIRGLCSERTGILGEMTAYARENHVPIVEEETAKLLEVLCMLHHPKRILEIGTAIGFSALLMYNACYDKPKIITLERYEKAAQKARENFKKADADSDITLLEGEAEELLNTVDGPFDMIFIDAAKGQYPKFFEACLPKLTNGGLIICDNVLYKGMIAADELVIRRKITIVKRLRKFLQSIMQDKRVQSSIIPIGDGVCICIKKGEADWKR